uniref:Uncharacterized protein n=1 Tax=Vombatus ursinus TaxID=29139 RepID=A0A4X2LJ72_VOMUR
SVPNSPPPPLAEKQYHHQQQFGGSHSASTTTASGSRHQKLAQQLDNFSSAQTSLTLKPEKRWGKSNIQAHLGCAAVLMARGSMVGGQDLPTSQSALPCGDMRVGRRGSATRVVLRGARASRDLASSRGHEPPRDGQAVFRSLALRRGSSRGQESPGRVGSRAGALVRIPLIYGPLAQRTLVRGSSSLPSLTKDHLDNQLDAYMVERKGSLEAELEACMAQTLCDPGQVT